MAALNLREIAMIKFIKNFRNDEDGAVTVDWVVLTAAVVGLAIAAFSVIETSTGGLVTEMSTALDGADATSTIGG
jgi:Flp pilus assembly pilin Flp